METSCLKNTNVANAFETLIELTNIEVKKYCNAKKEKKGINFENKKHKKNWC